MFSRLRAKLARSCGDKGENVNVVTIFNNCDTYVYMDERTSSHGSVLHFSLFPHQKSHFPIDKRKYL